MPALLCSATSYQLPKSPALRTRAPSGFRLAFIDEARFAELDEAAPDQAVRENHRRSGDSSGSGSDGPVDLLIGKFRRPLEYFHEHFPGQLARLRVLV